MKTLTLNNKTKPIEFDSTQQTWFAKATWLSSFPCEEVALCYSARAVTTSELVEEIFILLYTCQSNSGFKIGSLSESATKEAVMAPQRQYKKVRQTAHWSVCSLIAVGLELKINLSRFTS